MVLGCFCTHINAQAKQPKPFSSGYLNRLKNSRPACAFTHMFWTKHVLSAQGSRRRRGMSAIGPPPRPAAGPLAPISPRREKPSILSHPMGIDKAGDYLCQCSSPPQLRGRDPIVIDLLYRGEAHVQETENSARGTQTHEANRRLAPCSLWQRVCAGKSGPLCRRGYCRLGRDSFR